ncbi:MAG: glycosyltransferase family 1 protein [Bacteroidota bacterium]
MRIAINTRFLLPNKMEGFGWYSYEITKRLVENHPEHEFIFFFDRDFDKRFIFGENVTPVVLFPPARHPFLFYWWFEFSIKKALKKYKIDVFFSPDGYISLKTKIPQIATIHDLNFEHYPNDIPFSARKYLKYFFPKFAKKANKIVTVSNYSKEDLCQTYNLPESKISVIWNGASNLFSPLDNKGLLAVKNRYTSGREYFIFVGSLHPRKNINRLIEAFSIYKNKFPEGFDLVIVGEQLWKKTGLSFKISDELSKSVHFTGHLNFDELTKVMAAASCLTYVPYFEGFGIPLVEAMKSGVPIISGNLTSLPEIVGDAGILVNPFSIEEIADAMEKIYLDGNLRKILSEKGLERSKLFSWDLAAEKVWEEIEKLIK